MEKARLVYETDLNEHFGQPDTITLSPLGIQNFKKQLPVLRGAVEGGSGVPASTTNQLRDSKQVFPPAKALFLHLKRECWSRETLSRFLRLCNS